MSIEVKYPSGGTSLDPNEIAGLIPTYITTQAELDNHEQAGLLAAQVWLTSKQHKNILTDTFIKSLHRRMFKLIEALKAADEKNFKPLIRFVRS